jgi:hypothetical protein
MRGKLGLKSALAIAATLIVSAFAAPPAMAEFGINHFDVTFTNQDGTPATQAGSHPYAQDTRFQLNNSVLEGFWDLPDGEVKDEFFKQVAGFVGDQSAVPTCSLADFRTIDEGIPSCSPNSQVGVLVFSAFNPEAWAAAPVFRLEAGPGEVVRLGFFVLFTAVMVDIRVGQEPEYNVIGGQSNLLQFPPFHGADLQLWGNPADSGHDKFRMASGSGSACNDYVQVNYGSFTDVSGVKALPSATPCPSSIKSPKPFLTLPRSCVGPVATSYEIDSWQNPGVWLTGSVLTHDNAVPPNPQGFSGCNKLPFSPEVSATPSSATAESPTGLDFDLDFNQQGLTSPTGLAQSEAKKIVDTLPEGVTINPSVGEGLGFCSPADYEREKIGTEPNEGCPNVSKIGSAEVETPLLENPRIKGDVFLAQQGDPGTSFKENPFDSLIAIYIVLRERENGIFVKIPVKVEPDPVTGQLVATAEDLPQLPFSHFNLHFREGSRSPLTTPPACGSYDTVTKLYPWSDPANPVTATSTFEVTAGVHNGPCPPGGVPPFHPAFKAGSLNNNAGSYSPFNMRLIREDGEQDMTRFGTILPPGVLGKLAGVSKCPEGAIANARAKTGRQELASPSCPANSQIGRTLAGAGVGPALTYVPGKVYLAGPYKGDPLSVVSVTPAVAGPFDAGDVVVRIALTLNPKTAEVEVDGASSDPIPHILKGIPLKVRDLRVYVDRNNFILNPTSCDESSARATLFGSYLNVFDPSDDVPVGLQARYQAANCLNLGFKPKLSLRLKGGTRRGAHPALRALLNAREQDANIGSAVVTLPRSAFLDQAHIRTICTRVQFAANGGSGGGCPKGAQYGYARAWTPLLDEPVEGPVYLRSSNHKLPDLVAALHGLVDVNVVGRIDSFHGGIRSSFETVPDAPVSKFILTMQGGKKGLVVNSRELCDRKSRASAQFTGQNGKAYDFRPLVRASCGGKH